MIIFKLREISIYFRISNTFLIPTSKKLIQIYIMILGPLDRPTYSTDNLNLLTLKIQFFNHINNLVLSIFLIQRFDI